MAVINFEFRRELDAVEGGSGHNYCYQCGACVGDCPAAEYSERFNPRVIMLQALLGLEENLLGEDSVLWECTNCCTCYERCPQEVKPIDVIVALKNLAVQRGTHPPAVAQLPAAIADTGRTVRVTDLSQRRRAELGLTPVTDVPTGELERMLGTDEPDD